MTEEAAPFHTRPPQRMFLICCWQRDKQHTGPANREEKRVNQDDQERPRGGAGRGFRSSPDTANAAVAASSAQIWREKNRIAVARDGTVLPAA